MVLRSPLGTFTCPTLPRLVRFARQTRISWELRAGGAPGAFSAPAMEAPQPPEDQRHPRSLSSPVHSWYRGAQISGHPRALRQPILPQLARFAGETHTSWKTHRKERPHAPLPVPPPACNPYLGNLRIPSPGPSCTDSRHGKGGGSRLRQIPPVTSAAAPTAGSPARPATRTSLGVRLTAPPSWAATPGGGPRTPRSQPHTAASARCRPARAASGTAGTRRWRTPPGSPPRPRPRTAPGPP